MSLNQHGGGRLPQVQTNERRVQRQAVESQQLAGGGLPAPTKLQPAVDAGILPVRPAHPVHGLLHRFPAVQPEGEGFSVNFLNETELNLLVPVWW